MGLDISCISSLDAARLDFVSCGLNGTGESKIVSWVIPTLHRHYHWMDAGEFIFWDLLTVREIAQNSSVFVCAPTDWAPTSKYAYIFDCVTDSLTKNIICVFSFPLEVCKRSQKNVILVLVYYFWGVQLYQGFDISSHFNLRLKCENTGLRN